MKQHPDSVNRDLDDEVAEAIEHQYARRLLKRAVGRDGMPVDQRRQSAKSKGDNDTLDAEMEQLREKSGL
jgi:hypothetical protein